jgi:hypothetical protein
MRHVRFSEAQRASLVGSALVLAAVVCACLAVQGSTAARASDPGGRGGPAPRRAYVERQVSGTDLSGQLQAALGPAFGGVWFEPAGAALHVGVVSAEGRLAVEAVAAQAGLAGDVVATPVDSTWTQLKAAQERWDNRLRGLFARGDVSTSLAVDENAVRVELADSVADSVQASLTRQSTNSAVAVLVESIPDARLRAQPFARCAELAEKFKAYCDPTLVSGVSIDNEEAVEGKGDCTAGPLVIEKKPATEVAATETFLLTAGHCLVGEGAVGKNWFAFEKKGAPEGRKKIGKASAALMPNIGEGVDVGVIPLEAGPWTTEKNPPLSPVIADWEAANETEPFSVKKIVNEPPLHGNTCFSGQRSGTVCGEIIAVGKVVAIAPKGIKIGEWVEAYEVELEGKGGRGDSGSPFFTEAPYVEKSEGNVEGILVGGEGEESKVVVAQPLSFLLAELNARKGLNYELLTTANEKRH